MLSTAYRRHSYNLYFDLCDNLVTHEETVSWGKIGSLIFVV